MNAHVFGRQVLKLPKTIGKDTEEALCLWTTRDAFERLLRRFVLGSSKRIRWMVGTATGVRLDENNPSTVTGVTVRMPDSSEKDIPAALLVGTFQHTSKHTEVLTTFAY